MEAEISHQCCGCLACDRKTQLIQNISKEKCFLQIITELEISSSKMFKLWLCYECEAHITRFAKFQLQVKQSYQILRGIVVDNPILTKQKLRIDNVVDILLTPSLDQDINIKNEEDISTDIDIDNTDDTYQVNKKKVVKKHKKIGKKSKERKNKTEKVCYREIEQTIEEIIEERNEIASREEYVNAMFRCGDCIIAFPNEDDLKDHIYMKHELNETKHKCSICLCAFISEVAYTYHVRRHKRRFECAVCRLRCTSKHNAEKHFSTAHTKSEDIEVDNYEKYQERENQLKDSDQIKKSTEQFPCEFCPKVFSWKTSLRKHSEVHKIDAGQIRKPYCAICKLSFTNSANLQKHVKTSSKHQIQLKLRKLKELNPDETTTANDIANAVNKQRELFPCPQCDKKFQWRGNLLRHLKSHTARASGSLVCVPCDRVFASLATYQQHMSISRKHVSETDFKHMCSECGKKFPNKSKLKDHVNWEHLKIFVNTCADCQKVFKTRTSLYLHRQVVHKKADGGHLCENCGKSFALRTKLRSHMAAMHSRAAPYACNTCGARFSWHSCLSRHVRRLHPNADKHK